MIDRRFRFNVKVVQRDNPRKVGHTAHKRTNLVVVAFDDYVDGQLYVVLGAPLRLKIDTLDDELVVDGRARNVF